MEMKLEFPLKSAFLALPVPESTISIFQSVQNRLLKYQDILTLQSPTTPHITLQFWSSLMKIEYTQVLAQAEKIAAKSELFELSVIGAETFGSRGEDRVIYLLPHFSDPLARVKKSCPWPSDREFHPHITLARIKHSQKFAVHKKKIMKLLDDTSFAFTVDRLRLYAEIEGVKQTPLHDFLFPA